MEAFSIISAVHSAGRGGFDKDDEAIVQLYNEGRSEQIGVMESPSRQDDAQREYLWGNHMQSCMRRYEIEMSMNGYGEREDVSDVQRVIKAILEAIVEEVE